MLTVIRSNPNLDAAKSFAGSTDLKQAMDKAGVQGAPEIKFLIDA